MDVVYLGKIVNTHGIKGEVKVYPYAGNPERFQQLKKVFLFKENDRTEVSVAGVRTSKNSVLIKFENVYDMNTAEELIGYEMVIEKKDIPRLPKDNYYYFDLKGCIVRDTSENELGELTDVIESGAHDVYVVSRQGKKDLLIPALHSIVKRVDIEGKYITVSLPEGLYELYEV